MTIEKELGSEIDAAVEKVIQSEEESNEEEQEEVKEEKKEEETGGRQETEETEQEVEEQEDEQEEKQEKQSKEELTKSTELSVPLISSEILTRAIRAGLSFQEANSFPTEQSLQAVCDRLEQAEAATEEEGDDPLAILDSLDPEEYEPEVLKLFGVMADQIRAQRDQLQELRVNQQSTVQSNQEVAVREMKDWFDKQVDSLGSDFHEALGHGAYDALPPGSEQLAKRDAVADVMATFLAGCQSTGAVPPPREELFEKAAKFVLADEYARIQQEALEKKLQKRSKQHLQRAGGKGSKTSGKTVEEEIAAELDEQFSG